MCFMPYFLQMGAFGRDPVCLAGRSEQPPDEGCEQVDVALGRDANLFCGRTHPLRRPIHDSGCGVGRKHRSLRDQRAVADQGAFQFLERRFERFEGGVGVGAERVDGDEEVLSTGTDACCFHALVIQGDVGMEHSAQIDDREQDEDEEGQYQGHFHECLAFPPNQFHGRSPDNPKIVWNCTGKSSKNHTRISEGVWGVLYPRGERRGGHHSIYGIFPSRSRDWLGVTSFLFGTNFVGRF